MLVGGTNCRKKIMKMMTKWQEMRVDMRKWREGALRAENKEIRIVQMKYHSRIINFECCKFRKIKVILIRDACAGENKGNLNRCFISRIGQDEIFENWNRSHFSIWKIYTNRIRWFRFSFFPYWSFVQKISPRKRKKNVAILKAKFLSIPLRIILSNVLGDNRKLP